MTTTLRDDPFVQNGKLYDTMHEYLITQLQFTGAEGLAPGASTRTTNVRLNFNHPTRFLAWAVKGTNHGEFTVAARGGASDKWAPIKSVKLQLNGHDRFDERSGSYFNQVQPFEHLKTKPAAGVYMYNFGLRPDEVQPSGSCNMSRIDNATLIVTTKAGSVANNAPANVVSEDIITANVNTLTNLLVFAENFNVLRVMSGIMRVHLYRKASRKTELLLVTLCRDTLDLAGISLSHGYDPHAHAHVWECTGTQGNDLGLRKNTMDWTIRNDECNVRRPETTRVCAPNKLGV